jgi:hypothetical protein
VGRWGRWPGFGTWSKLPAGRASSAEVDTIGGGVAVLAESNSAEAQTQLDRVVIRFHPLPEGCPNRRPAAILAGLGRVNSWLSSRSRDIVKADAANRRYARPYVREAVNICLPAPAAAVGKGH